MMKNVRRGYCEEDNVQFAGESLRTLSACAEDVIYLLNRGYPYKSVIEFAGNHYRLTQRQRNALMRMCAPDEQIAVRRNRQLQELEEGCTVHIDAFNAVVLMETALSGSMILKAVDGCYRDLSGLAGTYAIIEKTDPAIEMIIASLQKHRIAKAVFWIDAPVSNSGRLKVHIAEAAEKAGLPIDIEMVRNADTELKKHDHVISGDSEVIAECISWYNLYEELIGSLENAWVVTL